MFYTTKSDDQPSYRGDGDAKGEKGTVAQGSAEPSRDHHGHQHHTGDHRHVEVIDGIAVSLVGDVIDKDAAHIEPSPETNLGEERDDAQKGEVAWLGRQSHHHVEQRREGEHHCHEPEHPFPTVTEQAVTPPPEADGEGDDTDGALCEAHILHRTIETAMRRRCQQEEDAWIEHQGLRQQEQEQRNEHPKHMGLLTDALDDFQLFLDGTRNALIAIAVVDAGILQDEEVQDADDEKHACHQRTLHRPRFLITAEEDLEKASDDDEHAVGDHQRDLRRQHLRVAEEQLLTREEHTAVVETGEHLMPCTQEGQQEKKEEQHPVAHPVVGQIDSDCHQTKEHQHLDQMDVAFEGTRFLHLRIEVGLQHPRQEERTAIESRHRLAGTKLQEHEQSHVGDHCRRNLFGCKQAGYPEPRTMYLPV